MPDILQKKVKPTADAVESRVGDETVLLHLKRGTYYGLDALGTQIWGHIKEGRQPSEICEIISAEYDVGRSEVEKDVRRFLEDLKSNDILVEQ